MQGPEVLGGRYQLRGMLGRGGMAEVRDGWDTRLGRAVAVKLLHPALSAQPDGRRRFEVEARAAAGLNHPHIVAVHDSGEHHGVPYLVMERLSGRSLADEIAVGPIVPQRVRVLLGDVLSAVSAAHAAGILHRDIKPANILLTDDGTAKVADFGIAKSADSGRTMTGQVIGTLGYLSPERIAGRPATVSDDLYAVGMVASEALTGRLPVPAEPPPLGADPVLASVIERAISPDPRRRFASADEMRAALTAARPATLVLAHPVPGRRRRWVLGVAAAVAAVLVLITAVVMDAVSRPSAPAPSPTPTPTPTSVPAPVVTPPLVSTTAPAPVEEPGPPKGRGNGNGKGNGNGHKPKRGD